MTLTRTIKQKQKATEKSWRNQVEHNGIVIYLYTYAYIRWLITGFLKL